MTEQLRSEGLRADARIVQADQVRYRVFATPGKDESDDELLARLNVLGFAPELTNGGIAITGLVSSADADEAAGRLEDEAIAVRVEKESRPVSYHVVRVGPYRTAEEAERVRVELAARALPGWVVRD